jgi:isopenicillin-N epimerase
MATLPLPIPLNLPSDGLSPPYDPLMVALRERDRIEVPVLHWGGRRWVRLSAQGYNHLGHYARLADAINRMKETLQT